MKKVLVISMALVMCFLLCACGNTSTEDNTWPTDGLGAILPSPDSKNIDIGYNLDDSFSADIENATAADFSAYVEKCKSAGFTIDEESDADEYSAYNEDGYRVDISYYDTLESVSIFLYSPKVNGTFSWPTIGLSTLIPVPDTNVGTIKYDSSSQFTAWIGEMSISDYNEYVEKCIEIGFNVDYNKSTKVFEADNATGVSLRLEYQGFDTMYISMYAPKDNNNSENAESGTEQESADDNSKANENNMSSETELDDEIRPEFKAALDSYEEFFDEYIEFMKKYEKNPTDPELLADYFEYMTQYADTMSKMGALDDGKMNDAETEYYVEVTARITQKLLEIASS